MMDDSIGGYFSGPNAVDTPKKDKGRRAQNIYPCCVRQILDCPGEELVMYGVKCQILKLVCVLLDYEVSSTKATYKLEDHTGDITGILWLESDSANSVNLPPVKVNKYVKVFGSYRVSDGEKTLLILKMMPLDSINEITTHLLEVIHSRLAAEKISKESGPAKIAQNNPSAELATTMSEMYGSTSNLNNFTPLQQKVFNIFKSNRNLDVNLKDVFSKFPANLHKDVRAAVDYLASEGHLYSTFDENTFKATD